MYLVCVPALVRENVIKTVEGVAWMAMALELVSKQVRNVYSVEFVISYRPNQAELGNIR